MIPTQKKYNKIRGKINKIFSKGGYKNNSSRVFSNMGRNMLRKIKRSRTMLSSTMG